MKNKEFKFWLVSNFPSRRTLSQYLYNTLSTSKEGKMIWSLLNEYEISGMSHESMLILAGMIIDDVNYELAGELPD